MLMCALLQQHVEPPARMGCRTVGRGRAVNIPPIKRLNRSLFSVDVSSPIDRFILCRIPDKSPARWLVLLRSRWMQPGWSTRRWTFPMPRALNTALQTASVTDDEVASLAPAATARKIRCILVASVIWSKRMYGLCACIGVIRVGRCRVIVAR